MAETARHAAILALLVRTLRWIADKLGLLLVIIALLFCLVDYWRVSPERTTSRVGQGRGRGRRTSFDRKRRSGIQISSFEEGPAMISRQPCLGIFSSALCASAHLSAWG